MIPADLLTRKRANFVLWRPGRNDILPTLFIGNFQAPSSFTNFRKIPLQRVQGFSDLWQIAANACGLADGQVYFYWFKALDTIPGHARNIFYCTDPIAFTMDRRSAAPLPADFDGLPSGEPASVILYQNGALIPCDPEGQTVDFADDVVLAELPVNNKLVIYELPTRWAQAGLAVAFCFGDHLERSSCSSFVSDYLSSYESPSHSSRLIGDLIVRDTARVASTGLRFIFISASICFHAIISY